MLFLVFVHVLNKMPFLKYQWVLQSGVKNVSLIPDKKR